MLTATMNLTLMRASADTDRAARAIALPNWVVTVTLAVSQALLCRRLRRVSDAMSRDVLEILELSRCIEDGKHSGEILDESGGISKRIEKLKQQTREIHLRALRIAGRLDKARHGERSAVASRQLAEVCSEYFDAVSVLHWTVLEHDANFSRRREGFSAESSEAVNIMLDRISSGE
jgi:hypothetical protein